MAFKGRNECKSFISSLLVPDKSRITAEAALMSDWVQKLTLESASKDIISASVARNLSTFHLVESLKRIVLAQLVVQASERELELARKTFSALDKNGDGRLSKAEIIAGLHGSSAEKDLEQFAESADFDKDGFVDYRGTAR